VLAAGLVAAAVAACDTGDGTTLHPPDGADGGAVVVSTVPFDSVPFDSVPFDPADGGDDDPGALDPGGGAGGDQFDPGEVEDAADGFTAFAPWADGGPIDPRYTCDDADISPPVSWAAPPDGTVEIAVALVDDSVIDDDGVPLAHWAVAGIAPGEVALLEGSIPDGAVAGSSFDGEPGYRGPCPPAGQPAHDYRLSVYALNQSLELADGLTAADMVNSFEATAIAVHDIVGSYQR
jgi:Raf kinase inhibitor-like YbhB/YbcL family protein